MPGNHPRPTLEARPSAQFSNKVRNFFSGTVILLLICHLCACSIPWVGKRGGSGKNTNPCVVLALPASGPFSPVSAKIKAGAAIAQKELQARGISLRLENINTEDPAWLKQLGALPEMCQVVGGPLQPKKYVAARNAGLLESRALFAFLTTLQNADEGARAWRFFPSQQDQIDALTNFATDEMGIHSYGAFYPSDNYGRHMTELLEKTLARKHVKLHKASYNPSAPAGWNAAVKPLINPQYVSGGKTPIPQTAFEAIFLPDSWKNMDGITSSLLVNGEDRLALLGTSLWGAGLSGKQIPKANKYELAVYPDAWNKARAPKSLQGNDSNFWTALGYDFVNFGVNVDMDMRLAAPEVTRRAQRAASAVRGMAPINWNNNGVASQRLYLFQVSPSGVTPLDTNRFRQTRTAVQERAALRAQGIADESQNAATQTSQAEPAVQEWEAEAGGPVSASPLPVMTTRPDPAPSASPEPEPSPTPAPAQVRQPSRGIMSPTPVPSYKLRLPTRP